jgi:AraC-like DNA-binding protein
VIFNYHYSFPDFPYFNPAIIRPTMVGHESVVSDKYVWDNKRHGQNPADYAFFQYTLSGAGMIRFQEKEHRLEAGSGFFCMKDHPYRYWFDRGAADHWEFLWIGVTGQSALSLVSAIQREFGSVVALPPQGISINGLRDILEKTRRKEWRSQTQASVAAYQLLLQIIEDLRNRGTQDSQERLDQALSHIREQFTGPLDISILSPRFGYTREHFIRLFRKKTGLTPGRYIRDLRIRRAMELLRSTRLSLDVVAVESGFRSANYLCRLFRQAIGMTPHEYRTSPGAAAGR